MARRDRTRSAFQFSTPYRGRKAGKVPDEGSASFPVFQPSIEGGKLDNWESRPTGDPPPGVDAPPSPSVAWTELEIASPPGNLEHSLRLLACWLLSAARKGAPVVPTVPVEGSQNRLDVARRAKVGSDGQ